MRSRKLNAIGGALLSAFVLAAAAQSGKPPAKSDPAAMWKDAVFILPHGLSARTTARALVAQDDGRARQAFRAERQRRSSHDEGDTRPSRGKQRGTRHQPALGAIPGRRSRHRDPAADHRERLFHPGASRGFSPMPGNCRKSAARQTALGHNPAGSWAIFALLALGMLICVSGLVVLGAEESQGILKGFSRPPAGRDDQGTPRVAVVVDAGPGMHARGRRRGRKPGAPGKPGAGHGHRPQTRRRPGRNRFFAPARGHCHAGMRGGRRRVVSALAADRSARRLIPPVRRQATAGQQGIARGMRQLPRGASSDPAARACVAFSSPRLRPSHSSTSHSKRRQRRPSSGEVSNRARLPSRHRHECWRQ